MGNKKVPKSDLEPTSPTSTQSYDGRDLEEYVDFAPTLEAIKEARSETSEVVDDESRAIVIEAHSTGVMRRNERRKIKYKNVKW